VRRRRFISRALPSIARLQSTNFPRFYILLQTGDYLLLQNGGRLKRKGG
jgi:hypothetical protein